jgi:uncharacterized protein (UPF0332 family)
MVSTEKILFSLQMAEESLQEVHLFLKDGKTRSLLNSLYNLFYYGMEALLFSEDIHSRSHSEMKRNFIDKVLLTGGFSKHFPDEKDSHRWEGTLETVFKTKEENEKGKRFTPVEVGALVQKGESFLNIVKKLILV